MKFLIATAACLSLFAGSLQADPLNPGAIPNNAKWIIHVDFDRLADSALADRMREKHAEKMKGCREWLEDHYGIDPRDDLHSLTMFSDNYEPHSGAAVLAADYDEDKVKQALVEAGATTAQEGDHTLYSFSMKKHKHDGQARKSDGESHKHHEADRADEKQTANPHKRHPVTAVLFSEEIIIFAPDAERAKSAIALLDGDSESLEDADSKLIADLPADAIFYGAAIDLGELAGHVRPFPVLEKHEHVRVAWGQQGDQMYKRVTLVAKDAQVAREMKKVLEGFVALGRICAADSETAAELYDDVEVTRNGVTVQAAWEGDVDDVMKALDELQPRMKAWRKHHRDRHHRQQ